LTTQPLAQPHEAPLSLRPDPVASIRRPGLVPRRLLMFGSGLLAGEGLGSHEAGLPGAVADGLARRSRRGADITLIIDPDPLSKRALEGLRGLRLHRFDAVIVILAADSTGETRDRRWTRDLQNLAALLTVECAEHAPAFIYGSSTALAGVAAGTTPRGPTPSRETAPEEEAGTATRVHFRELPAQQPALGSPPPFSPVTYESWADLIIDRLDLAIAELHTASTAARVRSGNQQDDEAMRRLALQTLQLSAHETDEPLRFLLRQAKVTFASAGAALVLVESEQVRPYAAVGTPPPSLARGLSYSNIAIQSDRPTVISDAHLDPRVPVNPLSSVPSSTRFYAAYPIHTWDGYRIGALCIYDDHPRDVRIFDLVQLWELAGQVEQHLWTRALQRGARPGEGRTTPTRGVEATCQPSTSTWQGARRMMRRAGQLLMSALFQK
jgi:GAF domain-containing protein